MSAMVKSIDLGKCPKLDRWIGEKENLMSAYAADLSKYIPKLLAAQHNVYGAVSTPYYEAIGAVARLMGCLCNDMTIIQEELYG